MQNDVTWLRVSVYRCANVCAFGIVNDLADPATWRCIHPDHRRAGAPITLDEARASGAACGPEAALLAFRTFGVQSERRS